VPGLEALLKIRLVAEREAQRNLAMARAELERLCVREREIHKQCRCVQEAVRRLESGPFDVREALAHRRYLNALRNRLAYVQGERIRAGERFEEKRRNFEKAKHEREAVERLIEVRRERERKERRRREERLLEDAVQRTWAGRV